MKYVLTMILLAVGCVLTAEVVTAGIVSETAGRISYRQPDGAVVELTKKPKRVVIGNGSLVQLWYTAGGTAVGIPRVPSVEVLPTEARELPQIGTFSTPDPEKVLALRPDLIILLSKLERHQAAAKMFVRAGVETVLVDYSNYSDFSSLLDFFCRLNGDEKEARAESKRIGNEVDEICRKATRNPAPAAAIIFASAAGFKLEGENSNTGTILKMLGGKNIAEGMGGGRINFSYERLFVDNPEVIFVVTMGNTEALKEKFRREIMAQSAWNELRASKAGRVHFLPAPLFLYQAGIHYPEAFRYLAALLYPEEKTERMK